MLFKKNIPIYTYKSVRGGEYNTYPRSAENKTRDAIPSALSTCPLGSPPGRHLRDVTRGNSWSLLFFTWLSPVGPLCIFVGEAPLTSPFPPRSLVTLSLYISLRAMTVYPFSRYTPIRASQKQLSKIFF